MGRIDGVGEINVGLELFKLSAPKIITQGQFGAFSDLQKIFVRLKIEMLL